MKTIETFESRNTVEQSNQRFQTEWKEVNNYTGSGVAPAAFDLFVSPELPFRLVYPWAFFNSGGVTHFMTGELQFLLNESIALMIPAFFSTQGTVCTGTPSRWTGRLHLAVTSNGPNAFGYPNRNFAIQNGSSAQYIGVNPLCVPITCNKIRFQVLDSLLPVDRCFWGIFAHCSNQPLV